MQVLFCRESPQKELEEEVLRLGLGTPTCDLRCTAWDSEGCISGASIPGGWDAGDWASEAGTLGPVVGISRSSRSLEAGIRVRGAAPRLHLGDLFEEVGLAVSALGGVVAELLVQLGLDLGRGGLAVVFLLLLNDDWGAPRTTKAIADTRKEVLRGSTLGAGDKLFWGFSTYQIRSQRSDARGAVSSLLRTRGVVKLLGVLEARGARGITTRNANGLPVPGGDAASMLADSL
ncbi:hypothetical protein PG990_007229 [Apiospora arundinis]